MRQPSWLCWQPIKFSPWLVACVFGVGILQMLVPVVLEWHRGGGAFGDAYWTWGQRLRSGPLSAASLLYSSGMTGALVWFAFFSNSRVVKDSDKFAVFLMLCGSAAGTSWFLFSSLAR